MKHILPAIATSVITIGMTLQTAAQQPLDLLPTRPNFTEVKRVELNLVSVKDVAEKINDGKFQVDFLTSFYGQSVYSYIKYDTGKSESYIAIQSINPPAQVGGQGETKSLTTYFARRFPPYSGGVFFDPRFSPNGDYVLLKFGIPWNNVGRYYLYVLDIKKKSLKSISNRQLSYDLVSWSPDNKYIVFLDGGDRTGEVVERDAYIGPLKLYVCDWRAGQENLVAENDTIRGPFSWVAPHTLFYSLVPKQNRESLQNGSIEKATESQESKSVNLVPNVYTYSVDKKKSFLLFKDGYLPNPSPNGEWVACYGSIDPRLPYPLSRNWQSTSNGRALVVVRSDNQKRLALDTIEGAYPFVKWLSSSQNLLTVQQVNHGTIVGAEIKNWEIETQTFRQVAQLSAKNSGEVAVSTVPPKFTELPENHIGDSLNLLKTEWIERDKDTGFIRGSTSLLSINLATGNVTILSKVRGAGLDWQESSNRERVNK